MTGPRILLVPGGTSPGAVAMAYASLHKLVELHEERVADPDHPAPHTVVVLRDPATVDHATLRGSATTPAQAFPGLDPAAAADPHLLDGIDVVLQTSGSSTGTPHLVGLSVGALIASARSTDRALDGPGRWILALPAHHVAGAQVLFRAALAGTSPQIVDTTAGFHPTRLPAAVAGATQDPDVPGYLSLVPTQLRACLEAGPEVTAALARLAAVLVGGSGADPALLGRARELGIRVHTTYGMTETAGGCVYDGRPLPGVAVRTVEVDGRARLAVTGPMLMTRYLDGPSPFIDEGGARWLLTGDIGRVTPAGCVEVLGRSDDVIVSGGLSVAPGPVRRAVLATPGVRDAWILDLPDEKWGALVTAAVVPEPGVLAVTDAGGAALVPDPVPPTPAGPAATPDPAPAPAPAPGLRELALAIREHVGESLGRAEAPRVVVVLDALPMLPTGKVDPRALRAAVEERIGTGAEWRR